MSETKSFTPPEDGVLTVEIETNDAPGSYFVEAGAEVTIEWERDEEAEP